MKLEAEKTMMHDYIAVIIVIAIVTAGFFMLVWKPDKPKTIEPVASIPEPTSTIVELTPTPTPEPTLSKEQYMEMYGGLPMGSWLSWERDNVSGYQDMKTHVSVSGYKEYITVQWWSVLWGKYFREGAGENNKFLFVFVNSYSDDNMTKMWGIQPSQFYADVNGQIYQNANDRLPPAMRIKEFDEVYDIRHVEGIKPYGYVRRYDDRGEEVAEEIGYLQPGMSNGWYGYIPFVVPRDTKIEDVKIHINTHNLAESHWWQLR